MYNTCLPCLVPPKAQSRKRNRNDIKPLSGLDVGALLGSKSKKPKISPDNPIPEFRQALDAADSEEGIRDAATQFFTIIKQQVTDSFGDIAYKRAIEELRVMREELIDMDEPNVYNEFIRELKQKLLAEELGGNRKEMWLEVRKNRLGLVEKKISEQSKVTEDEAKEFLWSS